MLAWLEGGIVFLHSAKAQRRVFTGIGLFLGVQLCGDWIASSIQLHGPLASIREMIQAKLNHRYDHVAWVALLSFIGFALKALNNDKKKLFG